MNIRSVTCFLNAGDPDTHSGSIREAGKVAREVSTALESAGFPVQTKRLAIQPLTSPPARRLRLASELSARCEAAGFEYLSLGPVLAAAPDPDLPGLDFLPDLIGGTDSVFATVLVGRKQDDLHLEAIRRTARAVREIAHTTEQGFGNLRLAMLANVGPHAPFFPAAYHDGGPPALSLATESADLAVTAFSEGGSLDEMRKRLVAAIEQTAGKLVSLVEPLVRRQGIRFIGVDFSPAPFPEDLRSIGAAVEHLGVDRFGAPGTLFAASVLTDCLRQAASAYPSCGFNGLMLPVLEDTILAARSREELFSVNDLLLYSAVCGTGLDTVPLPGDVSEGELAGILLDVAALAWRLDKPLTARLMPVPGAKAGDLTEFDFPYFDNGQVLAVKGFGSRRLFERGM
jgi:uncharacterized protein (UPF0210 family)